MASLCNPTKFYQNPFKPFQAFMFTDRKIDMHTDATKSITSLVKVINLVSPHQEGTCSTISLDKLFTFHAIQTVAKALYLEIKSAHNFSLHRKKKVHKS